MPSAGDRLRRIALLAAAHERPHAADHGAAAHDAHRVAHVDRVHQPGRHRAAVDHLDALGPQRGHEAVVVGLHARDVGQLARLPEPLARRGRRASAPPRPSSRPRTPCHSSPGRRTSTVRRGLTSSSQPQSASQSRTSAAASWKGGSGLAGKRLCTWCSGERSSLTAAAAGGRRHDRATGSASTLAARVRTACGRARALAVAAAAS